MTDTYTRQPVTRTATKTRVHRPLLLDLYSTAVGKKYVMAISGASLIGFVLFHMNTSRMGGGNGPKHHETYTDIKTVGERAVL